VNTRRVLRWYWPWAEAQESAWLQEMSRKGWHLSAYMFSVYTFLQGDPKEYLYRFDFSPEAGKDWDEYLGIFQDAGWEHVLSFGSWHYFRGEPEKVDTKEIYTDRESLIAKYRRLMAILLVTSMPLLLFFTRGLRRNTPVGAFSTIYEILSVAMLLIVAVEVFAFVRLAIHIRNLGRK
jgi:hypothetical protein